MEHLRFSARATLKNDSGFILIVVLLFLLATSFLVFGALETERLEMRFVGYQNAKLHSFLNAEGALKNMESMLAAGVMPPSIHERHQVETVSYVSKNACGDLKYRLQVWLDLDHAVSQLQSLFVVPSQKTCDKRKQTGEIFWSDQ